MGQPYTRSYAADPPGLPIVAGRFATSFAGAINLDALAPSGGIVGTFIPAWMQSTINQWTAVPNTAGAGGADADNYSGICFDPVTLKAYIPAPGGHQNYDNRVVMIDLGVDTPSGWTVLKASTPLGQIIDDAAYNADGTPAARHIYSWMALHPTLRKLFLIGLFGTYPNASAANTIDAFNIDTNTWDPAGTWPYTYGSVLTNLAGSGGVFIDPNTGMLFWDTKRWDPAAGNVVTDLGSLTTPARMNNAFDISRNAVFGMQFGNGWGSETGLAAQQTVNPSATQTKRPITFNASAALTTFMSDQPAYAGMTYDRLRDRFCFAYGTNKDFGYATHGPARFIEITPNASQVWDMNIITPTGTLPDVVSSGVCDRFEYLERGGVGGYLLSTGKANGFHWLRTQ